MTPEQFRELMTRIAQNADNQALVTELSTQAIDAFTGVADKVTTLTEQHQQSETTIQTLKEKNMELFLKVAQPVQTEKLHTAEPLTYEDLIKDLGGSN